MRQNRFLLLAVSVVVGIWPVAGRAEPPSCSQSSWVLHDVIDVTGVLHGSDAWRLAKVYRRDLDSRTSTWFLVPVAVASGTPLCPGDVVETWQDARTQIELLPNQRGEWTKPRGEPVASVAGESGSILEISDTLVLSRGTATYLFPQGMPGNFVAKARLPDGRALAVSNIHSTFQMSIGEGCFPDVDVSVSGANDPWDPRQGSDPGKHGVEIQVFDAEGKPRGDPLPVGGGEVGRLDGGGRKPREVKDPEQVIKATKRLQTCEASVRGPLSGRTSAPSADEIPALSGTHKLWVSSASKPAWIEVDGARWSPRAWWRVRDGDGAKVWEAARVLDLGIGPHVLAAGFGEGEPLVWRGESVPAAAGESGTLVLEIRAGVVPPVLPTPTPVRDLPSATTPAGPISEWSTRALPDAPMTFVELSGGTFQMGSAKDAPGADPDEHPQHPVTVSHFLLGRSEVTQAQWRAVVNAAHKAQDPEAKALKLNPSHFKGDDLPVEGVNWCEAARFANILSRLEGLAPVYSVGVDCEKGAAVGWNKTGSGFRLPTEAEWEYAARAGTATAYPTGEVEADLKRLGWYAGNSRGGTHPVCAAAEKPWGLCDMAGNVWEWTWDVYQGRYDPKSAIDPSGPAADPTALRRVDRGGGWFNSADLARSAGRYGVAPSDTVVGVGFRLVLPAVPPGP